MKEILIAFFIALIIGSFMNQSSETTNSDPSAPQQAAPEQTSVIQEVDENTFLAEVVESDLPVLVDFYAETCAPCKQMAPVLAQIADEYNGSLKVVKVDVLRCPAIARKYEVGPIPTFMVFKDGRKERAEVGAMSKTALVAAVKPYMEQGSPRDQQMEPGTATQERL